MTAIGGSIQEVSIAGRNFAVTADADVTRNLGGWSNSVEPNGNPTARMIKKRVAWKLSGLTLEIDDARDDQQFLQGIADRKAFVPVDITFASDVVVSGTGTITEDIEFSSMNSTAGVTLMGGGALTAQ